MNADQQHVLDNIITVDKVLYFELNGTPIDESRLIDGKEYLSQLVSSDGVKMRKLKCKIKKT